MGNLELRPALASLSSPEASAAGGSAAALVGAIAAAVVVKVARRAGSPAQAAQAAALSRRLAGLAETDAQALGAARAALADASESGDARRDFALGSLLNRAAAVPAEVAEACADVAALAAELASRAGEELGPDARAASWLAAAGARSAAHLVEINLAVARNDVHLSRAQAAARLAGTVSESL